MSKRPLAIAGLGMISCLGEGAEINAAAMRCDYDGFTQTSFNQPYSSEPQLGAQIESELRGIDKLSYMNKIAIKEAIKNLPEDHENLPIIYCMPEKSRQSFFNNEETLQEIIGSSLEKLKLDSLSTDCSAFWQQRCGFVSALKRSQKLLYANGHEYVLIVSIDSLLNSATLAQYGGSLYGDERRLLGDEHSNGFIPGEASTAVLLSKAKDNLPIMITGIGEGKETATIYEEEEVLKGNGIADAIKQASKESNVEIHDTGFRVSSVSGEDYFFREAALAQIKTLKQKVEEQPLWHPTDSIGEVGASSGGAIVIMVYYALLKSYSLGSNAICHISNDNWQRGAFIMQNIQKQQIGV